MYVTGFKKTLFMMQTPNAYSIEEIAYEAPWTENLVKTAEENYLKIVIPEYFEMRMPRNLPLARL